MKISLPLKLGIAVIVIFAIVIAGMATLHFRFKSCVAGLDSENPKTRWEAFEYLSNCGEKGVKIIEDFCRRHNDDGWGERSGNIRARLKKSKYHLNKYIYHSERSGNSTPLLHGAHFEIEVKNVGENKIHVELYPYIMWEEVTVETVIAYPHPESRPGFGGRLGGPGTGQAELKKGESVSFDLPYYLPRLHEFDLPGIYKIQVIYNPNQRGSRWGKNGKPLPRPPDMPNALTNKICIAVLPPGSGN